MSTQMINLTRGMPPIESFPTEDLIDAAVAALRNDAAVLLQYGRSPGYKPLRELLAGWYGAGPDEVLIANSSLEIVDFLARTKLGPGKRAFVESPSYDRAITSFCRAGAEVVGIPLEQDGIDFEAFERELRRGVPALFYTISDFQNPMGSTMSLAKRQHLARLAEQHDFWVIEDAPYRRLRYRGEDVPTIASLAPDRTFHLSSFSKTIAPGVRLGYAVAPAQEIAALAAFAVDTYIGPVFPTQGMIYEYLRAGKFEPNLERLKALYAPRLLATCEALARHLPGTRCARPDGGFFVGLELPQGIKMGSLLTRAAEAGLKLSDGRGFFPIPSDGERFLRLPFSAVSPAEIDDGIARLAQLIG